MPIRTSPVRATVGLALLLGAALGARAQVLFHEVGANAGVRLVNAPLGLVQSGGFEFQNHNGPGASFFDLNNDGWLDLIVADGFANSYQRDGGNYVFLNRGDGSFVDASAWYGIRSGNIGNVVLAADFDNNFASEVLVTNHFADPDFFRSTAVSLRDLSLETGMPFLFYTQATKPAEYVGPRTTGAALGDFDNDGLVDFFMVNQMTFRDRLVRNRGSYFEGTTKINPSEPSAGFQPVFFDYDGDGDQDIYQVNDGMRNYLYRNEGPPNWSFTEIAEAVQIQGGYVYADPTTMGMGCAVADFDNDMDEDVYVTNFRINALYQNPGNWQTGTRHTFTDVATAKGVAWDWNGWGCEFFDADNDGDLDLYLVNGWVEGALEPRQRDTYLNPNVLYLNDGPPNYTFTNVSAAAGVDDPQVGRGLTVGDYDRDGDLDMYVTNNTYYHSAYNPYRSEPEVWGTHLLYRNDSVNTHHWISLKLVGGGEHGGGVGCNRDAIGVKVYATSGDRTQMAVVRAGSGYMGQSSLELEFGLGSAAQVDELRVDWTCGASSTYSDLAADHFYRISESDGVTFADEVFTDLALTATTQGMRIVGHVQGSFAGSTVDFYRRRAGEAAFARLDLSTTVLAGVIDVYDADVEVGTTYEYELSLTDERGIAYGSVPMSAQMRTIASRQITLHPSAPNPFNPRTTLRFELPQGMRVRLEIVDARGHVVRRLADREFPAGANSLDFDGLDDSGAALASGVYYLSLSSDAGQRSRKLSLVR